LVFSLEKIRCMSKSFNHYINLLNWELTYNSEGDILTKTLKLPKKAKEVIVMELTVLLNKNTKINMDNFIYHVTCPYASLIA